MMPHSEHAPIVQGFVTPWSPILHFLIVPCHLRCSFPGDLLSEENLPLASTRSLSQIVEHQLISGEGIGRDQTLKTDR